MKTIIFIIIFFTQSLFAYKPDIKQIFAVSIYDTKGQGENIQHLRKTKYDYNGTCFTKVYIRGYAYNQKPKIFVGESIGKYIKSKPIYNKRKIYIGKVLTFKHRDVESGTIKVYFGQKLYDARVYVK